MWLSCAGPDARREGRGPFLPLPMLWPGGSLADLVGSPGRGRAAAVLGVLDPAAETLVQVRKRGGFPSSSNQQHSRTCCPSVSLDILSPDVAGRKVGCWGMSLPSWGSGRCSGKGSFLRPRSGLSRVPH